MKKGFTLVEILVVIAGMIILGAIFTEVFFKSLVSSSKTQILAKIKQNGQGVLEIMDKTIRGADNVVCLAGGIIVVENNLNPQAQPVPPKYTRFKFIPNPSRTPPSNGLIFQDNAQACTDADPQILNTLTDTNTSTGVSVTSGSFQRNPQAGFKDVVTIKFTLGPGVNAPRVAASQIDNVEFQTAIGLR